MPFPGVSYRTRSLLGQEDSELAKHFVVVYWDQRGSGKSNGPDVAKESITINRLTSDAVELADLLGQRFGVERVFLAGISWGTVLGLGAAARAPEKFHAYVGMAQIANWAESDRLAYRWAMERAEETNNEKAIERLRGIGPPPWRDFARWSTLRQWLMLFGGFYRSGNDSSAWRKRLSEAAPFLAPGLPSLLSPFFVSPDYALSDLLRLFAGLKSSQESLLDDIARLDFFDSVPKIEVPVHFFYGAHDQAVQLSIARRYFEALEAPRGKRLDVLEDSAHIFSPRDATLVETSMIEGLPKLVDASTAGPR
jgi:pimeloyl-ACP methyl ester carboxylesterase